VVASANRLESIDRLRGLVMVLMALDHVRDMCARPRPELLDFAGADLGLFFTRWVTHVCAPTFMLLAGVGACLYGATGRTPRDVSRFLVSRGLWLVLMELTVVSLAWNFNVGPRIFVGLMVIWAIGVSMIALGGLVFLPRIAIAAVATVMILGHNLLDAIEPAADAASPLWALLHIQGPLEVGGTTIAFVGYPLVPWIGVMALGYLVGPYFAEVRPQRPKRLVQIGVAVTAAFVVLRLADVYGEPRPWWAGADPTTTIVAFLDVTKYPPSLLYLLMTLGPAAMLLGLLERARGPAMDALATIGRVPFFYYVIHLYVIHAIAVGLGIAQGFAVRDIAVAFFLYPPGFGVGLGGVYAIWVGVVALLYPACVWFADVKSRRREWWIRYL
jgi:uncharacterized membrane protein